MPKRRSKVLIGEQRLTLFPGAILSSGKKLAGLRSFVPRASHAKDVRRAHVLRHGHAYSAWQISIASRPDPSRIALMCSHYQAEKRRAFYEKRFGIKLPADWEPPRGSGGLHIYPTQFAPIERRPPERESGDDAVPDVEFVDARFGLLPGFAKEVKYGTRTCNARSETVTTMASFKSAWAKARHCIVPCETIYEPDWRTGTHIPTRFTAGDSATLGVAGVWQPWKSPEGEWINSFTMLTLNADDHDLMNICIGRTRSARRRCKTSAWS